MSFIFSFVFIYIVGLTFIFNSPLRFCTDPASCDNTIIFSKIKFCLDIPDFVEVPVFS